MKKPILVSACLAGIYCSYNGSYNTTESIVEMVRRGEAVPFCPEVHGGLPTPRPPCEINSEGRVMDNTGADLTENFRRGAEEGLKLAKLLGCEEAVLKARSPSCGKDVIYDGTFTSTRVSGNGVFAELLLQNGIRVCTEEVPPSK